MNNYFLPMYCAFLSAGQSLATRVIDSPTKIGKFTQTLNAHMDISNILGYESPNKIANNLLLPYESLNLYVFIYVVHIRNIWPCLFAKCLLSIRHFFYLEMSHNISFFFFVQWYQIVDQLQSNKIARKQFNAAGSTQSTDVWRGQLAPPHKEGLFIGKVLLASSERRFITTNRNLPWTTVLSLGKTFSHNSSGVVLYLGFWEYARYNFSLFLYEKLRQRFVKKALFRNTDRICLESSRPRRKCYKAEIGVDLRKTLMEVTKKSYKVYVNM